VLKKDLRLDLDIGKLDQMRAVITATKENKDTIVAAAKMTRYKSTLMETLFAS
jgi:hypothetical protein